MSICWGERGVRFVMGLGMREGGGWLSRWGVKGVRWNRFKEWRGLLYRTYLFFFVPLLAQVLAPSGHFGAAHGVLFCGEMLLRLRFWSKVCKLA